MSSQQYTVMDSQKAKITEKAKDLTDRYLALMRSNKYHRAEIVLAHLTGFREACEMLNPEFYSWAETSQELADEEHKQRNQTQS